MHHLSSRWRAAATLSGRIDLSQALETHRGDIGSLSGTQLRALGVSARHTRRWEQGEGLNCHTGFLTLDDPDYPAALRPVPFAPPVLFHEGRTSLLHGPARVAIVGARRCTEDGRRMARSLAAAVAAAGGVVVSGMAHGIDTSAHLAASGQTIAVLGHGLAVPRARAADRTAQQILGAGGLLLSEFLPAVPAARHTFPQRNRVIAGLTQLTVVVEATQRSGAGITARLALEAGRDVGAVPGSPYAPSSAGCLQLLSEGAALIRGPDDLLALLDLPTLDTQAAGPRPADPVLNALQPHGGTFDALLSNLDMSVAELGAALGALELQGRVRRLPGDRFVPTTSSCVDPCAWAPFPEPG